MDRMSLAGFTLLYVCVIRQHGESCGRPNERAAPQGPWAESRAFVSTHGVSDIFPHGQASLG